MRFTRKAMETLWRCFKDYVFVMPRSHSRYRYVVLTVLQDQVGWARLNVNALGETPRSRSSELAMPMQFEHPDL